MGASEPGRVWGEIGLVPRFFMNCEGAEVVGSVGGARRAAGDTGDGWPEQVWQACGPLLRLA